MKIFVIFHLLLVIVGGADVSKFTAKFVNDYFADRNIRNIVVFECWKPHDIFRFARSLMESNMRVSFGKISDDLDMKGILKVNYYRIGVVLDHDCPRNEVIFEQFSKHRLPFNESYHWLVISNEPNKILRDLFGQLPLTVETELTFAARRNESYVLHDLYNPSYRHNGVLNVTFRGEWTRKQGIDDKLKQYKYIRRGNFHRLPLNFSYMLHHPALPDFHTYMTTPVNRNLDTVIRYHYNLVLQLRDYYNFTINPKRAQTWGYFVNGTWNGIVADMIHGLTDMSIAPFRYRTDRMHLYDLTVETYRIKLSLLFRHPKSNHLSNNFLMPFLPQVWYIIVVMGGLFCILLFLTQRVEQNVCPQADDSLYNFLPAEIGLTTIAAISQQGSSTVPQIISGRILFICLFLWALMLFQFYSASIVGSLLAKQPRFITTPQALSDSDIDVYFEDISYHHDYFRITTDPDSIYMYDKKIKPTKNRPGGSFTTAVHGLNLVKKGGYAFHSDTATAYKIVMDTFTDDEICELQEIEMHKPLDIMMVTSKNSPFRKMIIYGLRQTVQHGLTDALRKVWLAARPRCPDEHSSKPVPVQVEEFSPAVFLLLMGAGLALFVMIIELLCIRIRVQCWPDLLSRQLTPTDQLDDSKITIGSEL